MHEIIDDILNYYGIEYNTVLKPKMKNFVGLIAGNMFEALLTTKNMEEAGKALGCSQRSIHRALKDLNKGDTFSEQGGFIKQYLLAIAGRYLCKKCNIIKPLTEEFFYRDKATSSKYTSTCKVCKSNTFHNYYEKHKSEIIFSVASRRALLLKATPSWANLEIIKRIYDNAEGMHVDHIIPLQGETVCGLHVESNLQYLTPEENIRKSNKFDELSLV